MRKIISKKIRKQIYKQYDGHCGYCGKKLEYKDMQVDHIHPVALNGMNDTVNLICSCRSCNFYKSTFTLEKFREQMRTVTDRLEKIFIFKLARDYGIIEIKGFSGKFYFEEINNENTKI